MELYFSENYDESSMFLMEVPPHILNYIRNNEGELLIKGKYYLYQSNVKDATMKNAVISSGSFNNVLIWWLKYLICFYYQHQYSSPLLQIRIYLFYY